MATPKLTLVHGGEDPTRPDVPPNVPQNFPLAQPLHLPRVLVACSSRERFIDLPARIEFAAGALEAVANAIMTSYDAIVVDTALAEGTQSGYRLVRELRGHGLVQPIFLVGDHPLPSDERHARHSGATALLPRDQEVLAHALRGALPTRLEQALHEPAWLRHIIRLAREFFASEAERHVRAIYASLLSRHAGRVGWDDVVTETGELLDDLEDRRTFQRLAAQMETQE